MSSSVARRNGPAPVALEDAERFLREMREQLLRRPADGRGMNPAPIVRSGVLVELARERGISARTLERARASCGVRTYKRGRHWYADLGTMAA